MTGHITESPQDVVRVATHFLGLGEWLLSLALDHLAALQGWELGVSFPSCQRHSLLEHFRRKETMR